MNKLICIMNSYNLQEHKQKLLFLLVYYFPLQFLIKSFIYSLNYYVFTDF